LLVDLVDHGVNLIGFLDGSLELIVKIFGNEAEEGKHDQRKNQEDCDCTAYVH